MNVELLMQYRSIRQEMIEIDDRIKEIYNNALYPKGSQLTGMPRPSGYSNEGMLRIFVQIEELMELYQSKRIELNDLCLKIEREIDELPSLERRIIRLRYLDGKHWSEIGQATEYSVAQLHRIHKKILQKE